MTATRMFAEVTRTWNPVVGCLHECVYCWARRLARRLAKARIEPYASKSFQPSLMPERLRMRFRKGEFIFVCDMGDLFGDWVPREWIQSVLDAIEKWPKTTFLLLTKNPERYLEFDLPENVIAGATIESNRDYPNLSRAPLQSKRIEAMTRLKHEKMMSIEPILDFDLEQFAEAIRRISPRFTYIGYDNYGYNLPEPSTKKTMKLINRLRGFTEVRLKTIKFLEDDGV